MSDSIKNDPPSSKNWGRREFLNVVMAGVGTSALLMMPGTGIAEKNQPPANMTIQQVIDLIIKSIPGAPFPQTVDTVKAGNANQQVTRIVTTMFATDAVIRAAAQAGANFIIAHEPTFYNHIDDTSWLSDDKVYKHKMELLEKHNIVVWRFHDYLHAHQPDGVLMGVLEALGWKKHYDPSNPYILKIETTSLQRIIQAAKSKLGISHLRYIGDLNQSCSTIALSPGAAGGKRQIGFIQKENPDLLICGELNEWETSEYIRDLREMGSKTSLIVLGHIVSEEPGLQWLVQWLQPQLPGIPIIHIPSKDAFMWA